ncbi:hypothetical protein K8S19_02825 [bacterium]|nr:hypothetical protein [bacterium]
MKLDFYPGPWALGLETDISALESIECGHVKSLTSDYFWKYERETYDFDVHQTFRFGWGRIFEGKYAYQVMQIIADLSDAGVLKKSLDKTTIIELAEIITFASKAYIFDYRLKTMTALKAIMKYLVLNEYVAANEFDAFLIIDDTYRHLSFDERGFGLRINGRAGAILDVSNSEKKEYDEFDALHYMFKDETWDQSFYLGYEMNYENPLSRQWQFGASMRVDWVDTSQGDIDEGYGVSWTFIESDIQTRLKYYHNTRWSVSSRFGIDAYYDISPREDLAAAGGRYVIYKYNKFYINQTISLSTEHHLNPNMSLHASLGGGLKIERYFNYHFEETAEPDGSSLTLDQLNDYVESALKENDYNWFFSIGIIYRIL